MAKLTVDNGIVSKYSGNVTELTIPDGISEIADPKSYGDKGIFEGHSELTSVILPEGLLRIGESAFEDCIGLTNIIIPASVKEIGRSAFKGCKGLTSITIPDNVRIIEDESFSGCSELLNVEISENAEKIGTSAFAGCCKLTKINIPNSVIEISYNAFESCNGLTSMIFPDNQIHIGSSAFRDCSELTDVTIPNSVKYYSDSFKGCKKIIVNGENLFIKDSELVNYAGVSSDVVLPESVKYIGDEAFENHSEIISVTIPNSVEKIGRGAFKNCSGLKIITIPNSVTEIGSSAFNGCSGLISITIPESVIKIEGRAFEGCSELPEITLPTGLSEIKSGTFRNCSGMTDITIPNSVTKIELTAFNGCSSLRELKIPASIKIIDCGWNLEKINRIIIDPDSIIERIFDPKELLKFEYEISPVPMIPISAILEPENKIKFFFEYCKNPEKYTNHIAEEYEKYGRSQRSRILREAEKQNQAEVIAFFDKKGKKAAVRTLTPTEKADLMKDALEKGSDEDLLQVLKKYKNIGCEPSLLEKAICEGRTSKVQIFLDQGITIPEKSYCISELLKASEISFDEKKAIIDLCLSGNESKLTVDTDCIYEILTSVTTSYDEKKTIVELCLSHDLLQDCIELCYAACILNYGEIIEQLQSFGKFPQYLPQSSGWFTYTRHYRLFADLSAEQCSNALNNLLSYSDPIIKPEFYLDETDSKSIFYPDIMRFIFEHFTIKWGNWPGEIILNAVKNNQPESLQMLLDYLEDNKQSMLDDITDTEYVRQAIVVCVSLESREMLEKLYNAGWVAPIIQNKEEYYSENRGWKTRLFNDVIEKCNPELLQLIIDHGWVSALPSSFNKTNALRAAVNSDNPGALAIFAGQGWIRNSTIRDSLIDMAANDKKANALAWLLEYKNKTENPVKEEKARERKERKALDDVVTESVKVTDTKDNNKDLWKTHKNTDGTYCIDRYLGTDNNLTIPPIIGRRKITAIGKRAFDPKQYESMNNSNFFHSDTEITISEGITTIEDEAFVRFNHLLSIVIPKSVVTIGDNAFTRSFRPADDYYDITSSSTQEYFGNNTDRLVIYGQKGSYAEKYADLHELKFVSLDDSEKEIPIYSICKDTLVAYHGNDRHPTIPDNVKKIGESVFLNRSEIESITLPDRLDTIGDSAFANCINLAEIKIPDTLKHVHNAAFFNCSKLTDFNIPDSVISIGSYAFSGCCGLTEISIPSDITDIGSNTFSGCKSLTAIILPDSVAAIGEKAFRGCINLKSIVIPEGVTKIGRMTFERCSSLMRITIPNSVTCIDDWAFSHCSGLTDITLPDSLTDIGWNAFYECSNLKSIIIPEGVKQIANSAFENCIGLLDVTIFQGVTYISQNAFSGCSGLTSITIPVGVTIAEGAFSGCRSLKDIVIPEGVNIGSHAFAHCTELLNVAIFPGITKLNLSSFAGCTNLKRISIPSSLKYLSAKLHPRLDQWPEKLNQIDIASDTVIEKVENAEEFLNHEFEINPIHMIPISAIEEPEIKLKYFFEYCKAPDQYPSHVAESYIKYGKAQRSRILREATAQNQTEAIAYFEKELE